MKLAAEEQQEFSISRKHRISIALLYKSRRFLLHCCRMLKPLQKKIAAYVHRIFEKYAVLAYLADKADVGFFETFILQQGSVEKIIRDFEKRNASWKKETLVERIQGIRQPGNPVNFEKINMQFSLTAKKKEVIEIVREQGKIISSFGKRISGQDEEFYTRISTLYALWPETPTHSL